MDTKLRGALRQFTTETIFSPELPEAPHEELWSDKAITEDGLTDPESDETICIWEGGINIVSSRDARRNVRTAMRMAFDIAHKGRRVLYVNSWAGLELLRKCVKGENARFETPLTDTQLRLLDCKMGMWNFCRNTITESLYTEKQIVYHSDEKTMTQEIDVLILNSFEFSCVGYLQRMDFVNDLAEWLQKLSLSIILFTQTAQRTMAPGLAVRGPLGLLTTSAVTLAKVDRVY
jgi:hypothetical protein